MGDVNYSKKLNYKDIEDFGKCNLPVDDMAAILNIPRGQIQKWMDRETSQFSKKYRRGQALTRLAIAQRQILVATGASSGNSTLLTYLGAIYLGQNIATKQPAEVKEETAEKMLQNVSDAQKEHIFSTLTGVADTIETIDDESGDDESGIEADKGE